MINKKLILTVVVAGGLSLSSFTSQAATFSFIQAVSDAGPTVNKSVDGIDLTVSGATFESDGTVTHGTRLAGINSEGTTDRGLGVYTPVFVGPDSDRLGQVDGFGGNDLAVFTFSKKVIVNSISFNFFGDNDEYTLYVDSGNDGAFQVTDLQGTDFDEFAPNPFDFPTAASQLIGIGAFDGNDEFFISSIDVTAVPVPPSVLLMGSGLLGLAGFSRKRKAKV